MDLILKNKLRAEGLILEKMQQVNLPIHKMWMRTELVRKHCCLSLRSAQHENAKEVCLFWPGLKNKYCPLWKY